MRTIGVPRAVVGAVGLGVGPGEAVVPVESHPHSLCLSGPGSSSQSKSPAGPSFTAQPGPSHRTFCSPSTLHRAQLHLVPQPHTRRLGSDSNRMKNACVLSNIRSFLGTHLKRLASTKITHWYNDHHIRWPPPGILSDHLYLPCSSMPDGQTVMYATHHK